jgi:hypothetical protein
VVIGAWGSVVWRLITYMGLYCSRESKKRGESVHCVYIPSRGESIELNEERAAKQEYHDSSYIPLKTPHGSHGVFKNSLIISFIEFITAKLKNTFPAPLSPSVFPQLHSQVPLIGFAPQIQKRAPHFPQLQHRLNLSGQPDDLKS